MTAALAVAAIALPTAVATSATAAAPPPSPSPRWPGQQLHLPAAARNTPLGQLVARARQTDDSGGFAGSGEVHVHLTSTSDDMFSGIALSPGGKIVASGYSVENSTTGVQLMDVARRNPDGTPDLTFGQGGITTIDGLQGQVNQIITTRTSGVIGAAYALDPATGVPSFAVVRLNADGSPAQYFGNAGVAQFPNPGGYSVAADVAQQLDGRIVAVGLQSTTGNNADIVVRRLLPDGQLDPSFGSNGTVTLAVGGFNEAQGVAIQPDGKIVVAGDADYSQTLAIRLDPDGTLDPTFGTGGIVHLSIRGQESGVSVLVRPHGKIDLTGITSLPTADSDAVVYQLLPNGQLDATFGGTGYVIMNNPGNDFGVGMGLERDGSIVISAYDTQQHTGVTDSFLNRVSATGVPVAGFGNDGTVVLHHTQPTFAFDLAIQCDGKIVVAGRQGGFNVVDSVATIDRFNPDGSYDTSG